MSLPHTVSTCRRARRASACRDVRAVSTEDVLEELKQLKAALSVYRKLIEKLRRELAS